jgi:hypothetical protein
MAALLVLSVAFGCSTLNIGGSSTPDRQASGFSLHVWDDSYIDGASAQAFNLAVDDYGQSVIVNINVAGAQGLKALYCDLAYDATQYRPVNSEATDALGPKADILRLHVFKEAGKVYYGQIIANPQWHTGFTGSATVAQVMFRREPALGVRTVSAVPTNDFARTDLTWDNGTGTLSWRYFSRGDYNQDTLVTLSDLTAIGQNFGVESPAGAPNPWPVADKLSVVDGNGNGLIELADIQPIGANFGNQVTGYNVYHSLDPADYPATNGEAADPTKRFDAVPTVLTPTVPAPPTERRLLTYVVSAPVLNDYYWVRPTDNTNDGTPSNLLNSNPANAPQLALVESPMPSGSGTAADPYVVAVSTDYRLELTDPTAGNAHIENAAGTVWTVALATEGTIATAADHATLSVDAAATGDFNVSVTYNGNPSNPTALYFHIPGGGGGLEILPDPADTNWSSVTGTGSVADPYVWDHPADYALTYDMVADDLVGPGGNDIPVGSLTWDAMPPFIAEWAAGPLPPFKVNTFTAGKVFADQAAPPLASNDVYIEVHDLP